MVDAGISADQVRLPAVAGTWWAEPLLGILSVIAGVVILAQPGDTLETLMVISGIFVVLDSLFELATAVGGDTESRSLSALLGVLGIIAGILLIRHPAETVSAMTLIVGIRLVAIGGVRLASAIAQRRQPWSAVLGAVQLIAGIVVVANPTVGLATLALLIGLSFIVNGIVLIALGVVLRRAVPQASGPANAITASRGAGTLAPMI